jgi:hypothetical protein
MGFKYVKRESARAKNTPGKSYVAKGKKPKLGSGKRFSALEKGLEKKGAKNPAALSAWIGRKVHGKEAMAKMAGKGHHRAAEKRHGK